MNQLTDHHSIINFLACSTPKAWIDKALVQSNVLLIDHAHCEKKAASTALSLIFRYPHHYDLLQQMSRLAREELRHFEQVLAIMKKRNIELAHLEPSRYAGELRKHRHHHEPDALIDTLIIGAFIEARSCERFFSLCPFLDDELQKFYQNLITSEARHYLNYLELAQKYSHKDITNRILFFREIEAELIDSPDSVFRFHSGY